MFYELIYWLKLVTQAHTVPRSVLICAWDLGRLVVLVT